MDRYYGRTGIVAIKKNGDEKGLVPLANPFIGLVGASHMLRLGGTAGA